MTRETDHTILLLGPKEERKGWISLLRLASRGRFFCEESGTAAKALEFLEKNTGVECLLCAESFFPVTGLPPHLPVIVMADLAAPASLDYILRGADDVLDSRISDSADLEGAILKAVLRREHLRRPDGGQNAGNRDGEAAGQALAELTKESWLRIFDRIIDQSPSCIIITDTSGTILYVNDRFYDLTGYGAHEVLGRNASILKSGEHDPEYYASLWKTIAAGNIWKGEFRNKKKNGELYWEYAAIAPIRDSGGNTTHFVAVKEDITELKTITGELVRSEEKLRAIFHSIAEGVALLDLQGTIIQVNRAFMALQGAGDENLTGLSIGDFVAVDDRPHLEEIFARSWPGEESHVFQYRNITRDNRVIDAEMGISHFIRQDDSTAGFVAVVKDVTERKRIDDEILRSEARNRALVEAVPDLMFRLDDRGMYIDDYLRDKVKKVFPESIMPDVMKVIARAFETREIQVYEYPVAVRDELRYYEARIILSGPSEVLVILRNVTDRKMAEEGMRKARDEAESANRAKSEFLANMSHEIRTPLHSIMGFIEILNKTSMDSLQREYLNIVNTSARSLLGIINDILDFSKIESRKMEIDTVVFDPRREFESVIDLFYVKASEKRIELLPFIDPLLPETVMGDPLRIKQVLNNLLSNAVKFTPEEGIIIITVERVGGGEEACDILFSVSDTGIGIPDYKKQQIFEAFQQLDTSISRRYGGTGLGLSISLNLVRLMGGEIELESEAGEGSTFKFILTLVRAHRDEAPVRDKPGGAVRARAAVYANTTTESLQEELIMRYLQSLKCPVTVLLDFEEEYDRDVEIIFFVYTPRNREELRSVLRRKGKIPLVVAAHKDELPAVRELVEQEAHVITLPLNSSKLYNAILAELYPELLHDESLESLKDDLRRTYHADVLVAEDNATNRMLMKLMLGQYGIRAEMAANGLEAFDMFREKKYDMVMMDINMPVSDGVETTEMIIGYERERGLPHVPIVALTAKAIKGDREYLLSVGMDDYLPKPIEAVELRKVLARFLRGREAVTEEAAAEPGNSISGFGYDFTRVAGELGIPLSALSLLLDNFARNAGESLKLLEESVMSGDLDGIRGNAHRLKGTSANLRFDELARISLDMEERAEKGIPTDFHVILDAIKKEYERVLELIREKI